MKKHFTALHADEIIVYFNEDSGDAVFNHNEMGTVNADLNVISPDNNIFVRLLFWHIKFQKHKESMQAVWRHPNKWWKFCVLEDEKKELEAI